VARVLTLEQAGDALVSRDGRSTYVVAQLEPVGEAEREDVAARIAVALEGQDGVLLGGGPVAQEQVGAQVSSTWPGPRRSPSRCSS
jgi:hypothetical protein